MAKKRSSSRQKSAAKSSPKRQKKINYSPKPVDQSTKQQENELLHGKKAEDATGKEHGDATERLHTLTDYSDDIVLEETWMRAKQFLFARSYGQALPLLEKCVDSSPVRLDFVTALANCQIHLGLEKEAEQTLAYSLGFYGLSASAPPARRAPAKNYGNRRFKPVDKTQATETHERKVRLERAKQQLNHRQFRRGGNIHQDELLPDEEWQTENQTVAAFEEEEKSAVNWTLKAVALGAVVLPLIIFGLMKFSPEPNMVEKPVIRDLERNESMEPGVEPLSMNDPKILSFYGGDPDDIARAFVKTTDIGERLKLVRNPDEVRTRLAEYSSGAITSETTALTPGRPRVVNGHYYLTYGASMSDGTMRAVCVVATEDGPKVDWDAFARHGSVKWSEVLSAEVDEAVLRVFIEQSDFYFGDYRDKDQWLAYRVRSHDLETSIDAYARKDSAVARHMENSISEGFNRFVLKFKVDPEQIAKNRLEIIELEALGWVK